jgi:peptide/nickel transport system permease protein
VNFDQSETPRALQPEVLTSRRPQGRRYLFVLSGLAGRLVSFAITLLALVLVTFAMTRLSPIDPALQLVGDHASQSSYEQARLELGLDDPLPVQLGIYLKRVLTGDLGVSLSTGQPVLSDIARTFPATVELATAAIIVAALVGVGLGILAALKPGGTMDAIARFVSLVGFSTPIFWLGLLALLLFYARLGWLPGPGRLDTAYAYTVEAVTGFAMIDAYLSGQDGALANAAAHLVLPMLVLAFYGLGGIARLTRSALLDELGQDYVMVARAKGAGRARIVLVHALPNILGPLLTVLALAYANLLEGAVLTETVFAWPGIGRYLTTAMFAGDAPAVLGATIVVGTAFVLLNAMTDLAVGRMQKRRGR